MNIQADPGSNPALNKFGVGQSVPRMEDPRLLRGEGRYTDDINLPGQAYAVMVRSPIAHGIIRGIDTEAARALPGVLGVYTGADLDAAGIGRMGGTSPFKNRDGSDQLMAKRPILPTARVLFGGEAVAFVVAETRNQAKDAAELVQLDIESLPAIISAAEGIAPGAPQLHENIPGNVSLDLHGGDEAAMAAAFAKAAHVTRMTLANNRLVCNPMEPRSCIAEHELGTGRPVLHVASQGVDIMKNQLKDVLGVARDQVRIFTYNVGGSFGMKLGVYPEYVCCLHAAKQLGRPVKWTDERSESFLSDHHGRSQEVEAELALDKDGTFLAVRISGLSEQGAYNTGPAFTMMGSFRNLIGPYKTPLVACNLKLVMTNTTPLGPYRGAGRPEANYYMQRLIETAAHEMGLDAEELHRRNFIAPDAFPHKTPHGVTYDSGDFAAILDDARRAADVDGFAARRAESAKRAGRLRGIGLCSYLELTAPAGPEMGGVRFDADGGVTIITGTLDYGQGHASPFAQVVVDKLGIPFDKIRLLQGDSDQVIGGGPTGGSRSAMASGTAMLVAGDKVIEAGTQVAAHVLEAAPADIRFAQGRFTIAGTDRSIGLLDLAAKLREGIKLPPDLPQTLDVKLMTGQVPAAYPNGCHIAEIEIDPDTGKVDLVKYTMVNDFGTLLNPMLVEGQVHGGVVQGIGQALMEQTVYDENGQLLTGSFMDYAMPRADDVVMFEFRSHPVPAKTNPLGAKGCGEAGCAGSIPSVMNAVIDALSEFGIRDLAMPVTSEKVWRAIQEAKAGR